MKRKKTEVIGEFIRNGDQYRVVRRDQEIVMQRKGGLGFKPRFQDETRDAYWVISRLCELIAKEEKRVAA